MITALLLASVPALPQETLSVDDARTSLDRAIGWLLEEQREDGSWATGVMETVQEYIFSVESFYAWKVAAHALACLALLRTDETPERQAALERGVKWLWNARPPKRGNDWDSDYVWGVLYGTVFCVEAYGHKRLQGLPDADAQTAATGKRFLDALQRTQSEKGGWGYYDFPIATRRPTWDTSFSTALVLPSLQGAEMLDWLADPNVLDRAQRYVAGCALPNGAYTYDLTPIPRINGGEHINDVKGSLGRIQVCNWALASTGVEKITPDRIREGLENFFKYHKFLDVARMRPIPHEAYYANAGYFYLFGHYYAAEVIQLLPAEEREEWHARLRPHLLRAQRENGSALDFIDPSYDAVACTAFVALALDLGISADG